MLPSIADLAVSNLAKSLTKCKQQRHVPAQAPGAAKRPILLPNLADHSQAWKAPAHTLATPAERTGKLSANIEKRA